MTPRERAEFDRKTALNKRFQARYDELMAEGKHGHYETMFRCLHECCAEHVRARLADDEATIEVMVRQAADDVGLGLGDRWKGISIVSDLDDIAASMLAALRRKALGE